jgi:glycosyltransferase involved in cell wall biosynthesis
MDLFADMLAQCYNSDHAGEIAAEPLRPPFRARFSAMPFARRRRSLANADRFLNRFLDYPRWLRKQSARFELFHLIDHSYGQLSHELPSGRTIVTCHDLDTFRCLLEPDLEPRPRWFRAMAQRTLSGFLRCSHVISPSYTIRTKLLEHRLFPADRVTVIPPGVNPVFFSDPGPAVWRSVEKLTGCAAQMYLLHVGSSIRRKRIDLLLRVFAGVLEEHPNLVLLRVGGPFTAEQSQLAADLGLSAKIVHAPRLTNEQVAAAYHNTALLLLTSDAEGFGLPVIEGMACGCVVMASDIVALREAGGAQAEYCPVGDIQTWIETVSHLLQERQNDPDRWESRRAGARRHASGFSWPENARRTIAVYGRARDGVAGSPSGRNPNDIAASS